MNFAKLRGYAFNQCEEAGVQETIIRADRSKADLHPKV